MGTQNHELVRVFAEHGLALNPTLVEMLNEHYNHRTERRGCGYTQATRYLAELINRPLSERLLDEPGALLDEPGLDPAAREASLRRINALALLEESLLLARLITDIIKPVRNPEAALVNLPYHPAKLAIGTCPMAEKFFLELVHGHVHEFEAIHAHTTNH